MKKWITLLFLSPLATQAQVLEKDPYRIKIPGKPTHELHLRIINHGVKNIDRWVNEQIKDTETLYSQCGQKIDVKIVGRKNLSFSKRADELIAFEDTRMVFSEGARSIFEEVQKGKRDDVLDIHVVDHLNPEIRDTGSVINTSLHIGQAFTNVTVGWIFHGLEPKLAAQHVFVAKESVGLSTKRFIRLEGKRAFPRQKSLLAHEIGHLVLENSVRGPYYRDHWCETFSDFCPNENLMSSGGNEDKIWKHDKEDIVMGFDPLPSIDEIQCSYLFKHPLLKKK